MDIDEQTCGDCGASEWKQVVQTDYPERRQERDRTVRTVYECADCGAEGTHFEHRDGGPDTFSGAFR